MLLNLIAFCFILYGFLLLLVQAITSKKNKIERKQRPEQEYHYAIIIPARDESKVIEKLLESIEKQTYKIKMEDVYVIVESKEDKTVEITKKHHAQILFRKNLELQRKGYALDEAFQEIKKRDKKYDAYFIFDADNILDKNYIKEMHQIYIQGYDLATGYRASKNSNDNVISACSSLTFTMINVLGNKSKNKKKQNIVISGTGFYITGELIDKLNGYPFHSLVEDYELSLYATLHNLTTLYNEKAIYYDEQPTDYKTTVNQRVRWIKGYFQSRAEYIPKIKKDLIKKDNNYGSKMSAYIGVKPYISIVIGILLYLINNFVTLFMTIFDRNISLTFITILLLSALLLVYTVLLIITVIMIKKDKLELSKKNKIKTILFHPIFLASYIPCALKALFTKNVTWQKIEHKVNVSKEE